MRPSASPIVGSLASRSRRARSLGAAAALVLASAASGAAAQLPSIDARTWQPSTDPRAQLALEPIATPGPWSWNVGAWFQYAHHPVTLHRAGTDDVLFRPVEHVLAADLTASIGLGTRAAIGVDVPVVLFQDGSGGLPPSIASSGSATTTALGDVRVSGKGTLVANEQGGLGLAALGDVWLPTGDRGGFAGDGSLRAGARFLAEYNLLIASAQASLGYTLRTDHRTWPSAADGGTTYGETIPWSVGVLVHGAVVHAIDKDNRQIWELAMHGWLPAGPVGPFGSGDPGSARQSPVLFAASDRIALGHDRDAFLLAGGEIGVYTAVGAPAFRAVLAIGWAPRDHDADHDGVPDDVDQCPEIPEDRDGFEDEDGCPEIDNDDDGVVDAEDKCPSVAGVEQPGPQNGCPAPDGDHDGVPDRVDACPAEGGPKSDDPKANGCPFTPGPAPGAPAPAQGAPAPAPEAPAPAPGAPAPAPGAPGPAPAQGPTDGR